VLGKEGKGSANPQVVMAAAVRESYAGGEDDEIIGPIVLVDNEAKPVGRMENGDYVIFYDIRGEREIELSQSLTDESFKGFPIKEGLKVNLVTMIEYHKQIEAKVAFPPRGELREGGELADIAPTILELLGLPQPEAMTGRSLLQSHDAKRSKRIMLLILDGWGVSDKVEGNLIAQADTPNMDRLQQSYPATTLKASGEAVGLPPGAVGNSEAGHLHIGAG
jgi:bisphosphoglycerate-independent phosphoglycerate mutase (AlkP superfamily)